jgi:hypothetical protein
MDVYDSSTGRTVYSPAAGGLNDMAREYENDYGNVLKLYEGGVIDSDKFERSVENLDKLFDESARCEQGRLLDTISSFAKAMRVYDTDFFNVQDSYVDAFLSDVGRMYDNIRNHIKSGGTVDGLTKEIVEAGCVVSDLDDVKFLHSDKFLKDYLRPAMKALEAEIEAENTTITVTVGAEWVEAHAQTWSALNTDADADAISEHLKNLLLKLVNYGNDYRPGSFLQQRSYAQDGSLKV